LRLDESQHGVCCYSGINRMAALLQYFNGCCNRVRIGSGDHRTFSPCLRRGLARSSGIGRRDRRRIACNKEECSKENKNAGRRIQSDLLTLASCL